MTKAKVLKNFFKKFLNVDASGNSPISVLNDVMMKGAGGGGSSIMTINLIVEDENNLQADKTMGEIYQFAKDGGILFCSGVIHNERGEIEKILIFVDEVTPSYVKAGNSYLTASSPDEYPSLNFDEAEVVVDPYDDEPQGPPKE